MRAYAMVGKFLQTWAVVEHEISELINETLGLGSIDGVILARNTQLRDKINIAKTLLTLELEEEQAEPFLKTLNKVQALSGSHRNMVAHDFFGPNEKKDGVKFFANKAKGKLKIGGPEWSLKQFKALYDEMSELAEAIEEARKHLVKARKDRRSNELSAARTRNALMAPAEPNELGLGMLSGLVPTPEGPDSVLGTVTQQGKPGGKS